MNKFKNQRGILLLCTLVIMVILSVFLMVGVYRMESSVMATKKTIWEIKSYWAARAGNTIATYGCIKNNTWPNDGLLTQAGGTIGGKFYGYNIELKEETLPTLPPKTNKFVSGVDSESDSHFNIYYVNKSLNTYLDSSNTVNETTLLNNFNNMSENISPYEIYCLTAGKSGASIVGLELVYQLSYNPNLLGGDPKPNQSTLQAGQSHTASAAIYAGGNIDATLNNLFTVEASDTTRACIVSGGDVNITGAGGSPTQDGGGSLNIYEGAIFANNANINGQNISPSNTNSNLINYGINVFSSSDVSFSFPESDEIEPQGGKTIPQGTFCFVEMPRDYQEVEYRAIINTMKSMYLTPEQFSDIYLKKVTQLGNFEEIKEALDNDNNFKLINCSGGQYDCNSIFDSYFSSADEYFTQQGEEQGGFLNWLTTRFTGEMEAGESNETVKQLYRYYLISKINDAITEYRYQPSAENTSSPFEAFFVPDGVANISKENSRFNISYAGMTRARLLGNLARYAKVPGYTDEANPDDENTNYYNKRYIDILQNKLGLTSNDIYNNEDGIIPRSKKQYKENFQQEKSGYVTKREPVKDGKYIQILKNLDGSNDADLNFEAANDISFDTTELQMETSCNLTSTGYFNFATYERTGDERADMYWMAHDQVGDYKTAEKARAGIKLTGGGAITADNINIKGFVYTSGANNPYLQSKENGDIIFEAPGSSVLNSEGKVSILSGRNIEIKRASAEGGTNAGGDVTFKGILYSDGNLYVDAGSGVNFDLTGTIICKGAMTMSNLNSVNVIYDPSVSRIVLSRFIPSWRTDESVMENAIDEALKQGKGTIYTGTFKFVNRI